MKTIEIRSLLQGKEKIIDIPVEIVQAYRNWKSKRNKDDVINPEEIFYAGYVMSNPIVRQQYADEKKRK